MHLLSRGASRPPGQEAEGAVTFVLLDLSSGYSPKIAGSKDDSTQKADLRPK